MTEAPSQKLAEVTDQSFMEDDEDDIGNAFLIASNRSFVEESEPTQSLQEAGTDEDTAELRAYHDRRWPVPPPAKRLGKRRRAPERPKRVYEDDEDVGDGEFSQVQLLHVGR